MAIPGVLQLLSAVAVATTDPKTLKGEDLLKALEEKEITFSSGETPRKTVIEWLQNPYSGYIEIARSLLNVLDGRKVRAATGGKISLTNIKGSVDQLKAQKPGASLDEIVKDAFVYRWNEQNGGDRSKDLEYIAPKGKVTISKYEKLSGEGLMRTLEAKNITFSDGDIPRATVVKWLDDKFSGYRQVARDILEYLDSREPLAQAAFGKVSLVMLKTSIDSGMNIESAIIFRWNEKNGGNRDVPISIIAPKVGQKKEEMSFISVYPTTPPPPIKEKITDIPGNYLNLVFEHWKSIFLGTVGGKTIVVDPLKSDGMPDKRPSEGIGYGMIFSAWLSDPNTLDALVDSLYALFMSKSGPNEGLPAWGIDKSGKFMDSNSASDADLDISIALIKRYRETGKKEYKAKALALLHRIKEKEIAQKGNILILKPSSGFGVNDADGSVTINPSYFAVGYYDVFAEIDTENASFWKQLKSDSYKILNAVFDKYKRFPDWAKIKVTSTGKIIVDKDFVHGDRGTEELYDGIRTYWRIATDVAWNNDPQGQALLAKALSGKTPQSISFDGMANHSVGVFMYAAGATGAGNVELLSAFTANTNEGLVFDNNQYYFQLGDKDAETRYFNQSLCLLAKMLIDGKFTRP